LFISLFAGTTALQADDVNAENELSTEFEEVQITPSQNEIEAMERLITLTESKLESHKKLKDLIVQFKGQQEKFLKNDQDKKSAFKMCQTASVILQTIKDNHIEHLYAPKYLDELKLFSSIASRNAPVRP
jgi:hypothetical protein